MKYKPVMTRRMLQVESRLPVTLDEHLRQRYLEEGASIQTLGAELGVSPSTVWCWLLAYGFPRRGWSFPSGETAGTTAPAED